MTKSKPHWRNTISDIATDLLLRALIGGTLVLPYRARLASVGWFTSRIVFPLAGHAQRIRDNLSYIFPDMPEAEIKKLLRDVPNNFGRTLIEEYSGPQFLNQIKNLPIHGAGMAALEQAKKEGRGVVMVSGHFGNYDAARGALVARGFRFGALYRPFNNKRFDRHYRQALESIGTPIFARSRRGEAEMIRFLKSGGIVGLLADQHMSHGAELTFFDKPAASALSAAKMALKYDALLICLYAERQPDGISFNINLEEPILHSTPEEMTQLINDSLEARIRANIGQWLWSHRRWKSQRRRKRRS